MQIERNPSFEELKKMEKQKAELKQELTKEDLNRLRFLEMYDAIEKLQSSEKQLRKFVSSLNRNNAAARTQNSNEINTNNLSGSQDNRSPLHSNTRKMSIVNVRPISQMKTGIRCESPQFTPKSRNVTLQQQSSNMSARQNKFYTSPKGTGDDFASFSLKVKPELSIHDDDKAIQSRIPGLALLSYNE